MYLEYFHIKRSSYEKFIILPPKMWIWETSQSDSQIVYSNDGLFFLRGHIPSSNISKNNTALCLNWCELFVANIWRQKSFRNRICRKYEPGFTRESECEINVGDPITGTRRFSNCDEIKFASLSLWRELNQAIPEYMNLKLLLLIDC